MWTGYYPMEQSYDLSLDAGLLLYEMDKFAEALGYLECSMHASTEEPLASVLYSMAICNYELGAEGLLHWNTRVELWLQSLTMK